VQHLRDVAVVAGALQRAVQLGFGVDGLGQLALRALVEHGDDGADHFEMRQLFGGDVEQHVLAARVVLGDGLREVAHRRGEFALRAAELFEHQVGKTGIAFADAHRVLQALVVCKHTRLLVCAPAGGRAGIVLVMRRTHPRR
jgi:hypothetical protein